MNSFLTSCRLCTLAVLLCVLSAFDRVEAASGLSYTLDTPPSWVSSYQEPPDRYSVSLGNIVHPHLVFELNRRPELIESSYDAQQFRFQTKYYRRGADEKLLVPIAVDASSYSEFRRRQHLQESWDELAEQQLNQAQKTRQQGGLGVSINLPKRLDKIFGEGGAGLRVSGYRKIMFSGRSQWTDGVAVTTRQSKFPSLNMEQMYQFDITGTIGSKITVKVAQDSHTELPLSNSIQIRYKGDDDEIIKTIEAGNTNLSLPNTQFVGYSSHIRGLFGLKAEAQLGRLTLTGIASQEKGSSERTTITPTGEESAQIVRDADYAQRRIFDLGLPGEFQPGDSLLRIFLFKEMDRVTEARPADAVYGILYVDPSRPTDFTTENMDLSQDLEKGVVPIETNEFEYYSKPDSNRHYVVFLRQQRPLSIGAYMEVKRADGSVDTIGINSEGTASNPKRLKLLYNRNENPAFRTWDLMWRNTYEINQGTEIDDIDVKIYKGLAGTENTTSPVDYQEDANNKQQKYLEILGLDQYNRTGSQRSPDSKLDDRSSVFRPDWGLIIFPSREPFNSDTTFINEQGSGTQPLAEKIPELYDYESATEKTKASKYFLKLFTKSRSNDIRLGRPNIIEGSERITANGRTLQKGVDYNIDYDFGRVTLLSTEARDPNADIDIDFEYAPFLSIQKKTLFGFRAEYAVARNLSIGSTVLFKSDKARDRKPRVGEETAKSLVFDFDADWSLQPNFLTRLADALPIVKTEVQSNLRLSGELAQSRPNPNVDGEAYVDDYEASAEQMTLGTNRTQWHKSSKPVQLGDLGERSRLLWHNPRTLLKVSEVYDREAQQGQSTFRSLRLVFRPNVADTQWNWVKPDPDKPTDSIPQPTITNDVERDSWAGMQRHFGGRIDKERVQVFELRARARTGRMHIEFGRISDDVNNDGKSFSEDQPPTQQFDPEEDIGIDGLNDSQEPFWHPEYNPDPNHDNWYFQGEGKCPFPPSSGLCNQDNPALDQDSLYYEFLNGTEGNRNDFDNLAVPDKEILGTDFEDENGYFSYVVDFADPNNPFRVEETVFPSPDPNQPPWYTYRIPIRDSVFLDTIVIDNTEGSNAEALRPEWSGERISHVRVWFEEAPSQTWNDTVEIADWYFVQSQWRDTVIFGANSPKQTKLTAASISEEDHTFKPPPGVEPYEDPTTSVVEAQRGLQLKFENLDYRDVAEVRKNVLSVDKYSGYRRLKMYVYDSLANASDYGHVMFYFRVGKDTANFYEQRRVMVNKGWDPANYIDIDFNEITAIKDAAQRGRERAQWPKVDTVTADGRQRVRGDPSLNEIKYFAAGIINLDSTGIRVPSGEVWLDELRVNDVRRDVGTAARFSATGNIADLGNYSFQYQTQDPYFRGLSSSTRGGSDGNLGSGSSDTRLSYSLSLNVDKFLPKSWGTRLPVSYSYSKNTRLPLLRTGSDIVLPEEVRRQEQEVSESKMISVSASFNKPGKNPLFSLLLNRLQNTSFSYRRSLQESPRTPYGLSEGYNLRSGFNLGLTKAPTAPIMFWTKDIPLLKRLVGTRLGLYPSRWSTSFGYDRTLTVNDDIDGNRRSSFQRTLDAQMDLAYNFFENLTMTLRLDTRRDLSDDNDVSLKLKSLKLGLETRYSQQFGLNYDPKLFHWFSTDFGFTGSYSDDYERSSATRRSTMNSSWGVSGRFDHIAFLGGAGSAGGDKRRFRGSGGTPGGRRADRGAKTEEKQDSGRPFYDPPLAVLRFLTGWIEAPSYSYNETFRYSLPGTVQRPGLKYRLGLSRTPGVAVTSGISNAAASEGLSYDVGTGFSLLGGFQTTVKYRRGIERDVVSRGDLYEDITTSWPDLTIQIRPFRKLPIIGGVLNKFIDVFAPRTGYTRSTRERRDLARGFLTSRATSISQNPVISLNFKLFKSLSMTSSYARTEEKTEQFSTTTGGFQTGSESVRSTIGGSAQYSFSAPSGFNLPLFGKVKFRSSINISLDVKYNTSSNRTRDASGAYTSSTEKDEIAIRPDISYTFSQQIKGGLSMRWQDTNTGKTKTHLREVQLWMEIRF